MHMDLLPQIPPAFHMMVSISPEPRCRIAETTLSSAAESVPLADTLSSELEPLGPPASPQMCPAAGQLTECVLCGHGMGEVQQGDFPEHHSHRAPRFLLIFYIWVVPQSARWLLPNDRREEAIALLRKAALVNGRVLPPVAQVEKCEILSGGKRSHTAVDLVRTPQMRKRAIILFYIWFVNVLVYYGLSLGVSRLGTNLYLTQFVFGLVEIPARSLVLLVLPCSRRLTQTGFLAVGGLACLLMLTVPADHPNVLTGLAMVGKFGIAASFAVIYVYTAEIFPTVLRQTGIGVSCMFARMGGVLAPVINMLYNHSPVTPLIIFGTSPLVGAVLALALPETADRPLPDTVEDVENWDMRSPPDKDNAEMCDSIRQSASRTEQEQEQELQHLASQT
ncbi:solute carrier family 22 member 13-like isoform X1 [Lates japonicus]|uniref:Solute carrier family 22 member 13-like isoform X1 n=1 Tax=Lates japonicus TaxID=270547 RepID=A0AAD3MR90_LATJO|nr:solute carrier family 22 member 13-like isoform X1 [Lates japonicus]